MESLEPRPTLQTYLAHLDEMVQLFVGSGQKIRAFGLEPSPADAYGADGDGDMSAPEPYFLWCHYGVEATQISAGWSHITVMSCSSQRAEALLSRLGIDLAEQRPSGDTSLSPRLRTTTGEETMTPVASRDDDRLWLGATTDAVVIVRAAGGSLPPDTVVIELADPAHLVHRWRLIAASAVDHPF